MGLCLLNDDFFFPEGNTSEHYADTKSGNLKIAVFCAVYEDTIAVYEKYTLCQIKKLKYSGLAIHIISSLTRFICIKTHITDQHKFELTGI